MFDRSDSTKLQNKQRACLFATRFAASHLEMNRRETPAPILHSVHQRQTVVVVRNRSIYRTADRYLPTTRSASMRDSRRRNPDYDSAQCRSDIIEDHHPLGIPCRLNLHALTAILYDRAPKNFYT